MHMEPPSPHDRPGDHTSFPGTEYSCPHGHRGPWRFVEALEVQRDVTHIGPSGIDVNSTWLIGTEFEDVIPGSGYLLCWFGTDEERCCENVDISEDTNIMWD